MMAETIETRSDYRIEVSAETETNLPVYLKVEDMLNGEYFGVWLSREESVRIAHALLAAVGESEAKHEANE